MTTNLLIDLQRLAERTLAKTKPASALVAIRPSTGAVVAAANNAGTKGQSLATVGQNPPGSTFKVVSALALLRAGLTPGSPVGCPRPLTVDGKRSRTTATTRTARRGRSRCETALAQSCNTAFIGQRGKLKGAALAEAAGSLGLGIDYDVGLLRPSSARCRRTRPPPGGRPRLIGQGKVEASALAMAVGGGVGERPAQTVLPSAGRGTAGRRRRASR